MNGLIENGMVGNSARNGANTRQRPAGTNQELEDGVRMNPENAREQRNAVVNAILSELYGPQLERTAEILKSSAESPAEGIGRIVNNLLTGLIASLADNGQTVPPGVVVQAAMMVSQAIGEMAMRMGIIDQSTEKEAVEDGFLLGLANFVNGNAGTLKEGQAEKYEEIVQAMVRAKAENDTGPTGSPKRQQRGQQRQQPRRMGGM